jgi:hypothetical protein
MRTCNYDEGLRGLFQISPLNLTSNLCDTHLRHIDIMVSFIPIERADMSNCFGLDEKHDDNGPPLTYAFSLDRINESTSKNILGELIFQPSFTSELLEVVAPRGRFQKGGLRRSIPLSERSGRRKIGRSGFSFLVFTCMPSLCDGILRQTRESPPASSNAPVSEDFEKRADVACSARLLHNLLPHRVTAKRFRENFPSTDIGPHEFLLNNSSSCARQFQATCC